MKTLLLAAIVSTLALAVRADDKNYSPGVADVVKLSQADVKSGVVEKFVESTPGGYQLRADDILYLKQQGVEDNVIVAMLKRSKNAGSNATVGSASTAILPAQQAASNMQGGGNTSPFASSYPVTTVAPGSEYVPAPAPVYVYQQEVAPTYYYSSLVDPYYPNFGFGFSYYPSYRSHFGFNSYPYRYAGYRYNSYPYRSSFSSYNNSYRGSYFGDSHYSRGTSHFSGSPSHGFGGAGHRR
ncbi:MAG: hypothetical protein JWN25_2224 [Verrucomicrobiales bacterium]|jgi:hypothetical protein|nr:hypothetical protein [Verrucomicrobiales bacterium]MDB6130110.1 hypothetical protein [Verrucomicrobiales bacterium]